MDNDLFSLGGQLGDVTRYFLYLTVPIDGDDVF